MLAALRLGSLALALSLSWTPVALARPPSCEPVERVSLPNGVEALLLADSRQRNVVVVSSVHAGQRHDPPGHAGLAHLVQHLTLLGTKPFPAAGVLYDAMGASDVGTSLSLDTTTYHAVVPGEELERAIWLEARRMALGLDLLGERDVRAVQPEYSRAACCGAELDAKVEAFVSGALFGPEHPYALARAASADGQRLTLAAARWFFAAYHRPERVKLALVGAFDVARARHWIQKYWGNLRAASPAASTPERECVASPSAGVASASRLRVRSRNREEWLVMYWLIDPSRPFEQDQRVLRIFEKRLLDAAQELGLSRRISLTLENGELVPYWRLSIGVIPGKSFDAVEPLVRSIAADLRAAPPDERTLVATRQEFERQERMLESAPLQRALRLVRPECAASACVTDEKRLASDAFAALDALDPSRAVVVEWRYGENAPESGSVERAP